MIACACTGACVRPGYDGPCLPKPGQVPGFRPMSEPMTGKYVELWIPKLGVYGARPEEVSSFPLQPTGWRKP